MRKAILFTFIYSLFASISVAQVLNVDREIESDTTFRRVRAALNFNFANDKQKRNLLDFTNVSEIDFFLKNNYLFILLSNSELAFNGNQVLENNGFFQFRFRDNDSRKVAPDVFTQYQWNGIQGLQNRALLGANARFRWLEKKKSDLYTSLGLFYEFERWNPFLSSYAFHNQGLNIVNRNIIRFNTSAKFAIKISKEIDFAGSTYVQFPLNSRFLTPRWFLDANLHFTVNKHLGFVIHFDHNWDTYRPLPIDNYYYTFQIGMTIRI
ncbi:MAG: hypothetical protein RL264_2206 [Bacteroidota bacterium]|jgi:hypothetical protein